MKESLVDVSPSIVMQLNDASAASFTILSNSTCGTFASQATNPSMVAIFGRIMPAPLEIPVSVTFLPEIVIVRDAAFGSVSVVMMDCAALNQLFSVRFAMASGKPATNLSTGRGSRITPVENGSTCDASQPKSLASASQVACAFAIPASPVPAFAFPVFTTKAAMGLPDVAAVSRCAFDSCTGAAQKRLVVNTPETVAVGASFSTSRSLRFGFLMPASA